MLLIFMAASGLWLYWDSSVPKEIYSNGQKRLVLAVNYDSSQVKVQGFSQEALHYLRERSLDLSSVFKVYAIPGESGWDHSTLPVDGNWEITKENILFRSRHDWLPDVNYVARLDQAALNAFMGSSGSGSVINTSFTVPRPADLQPEHVTDVYPSADVLPQNLLKFYIHFSGPMARGNAYEHIYILNEEGEMVPDAFLELPQELWDPHATRLTILFDPGRIKRGLERHNLMGVAFEPGKEYTLVVDSSMIDGNGLPIGTRFEKSFHITKPDSEMLDHEQWTINIPDAGSRRALVIHFDESLDHALLHRMIDLNHQGNILFGHIETNNAEKVWRFIPDEPWQAGHYSLEIKPELEDLAGNNLISVFDVQLSDSTEQSKSTKHQPGASSNIVKNFEIKFTGKEFQYQ